ncbi:MAG: V-type ATP synthase subunit F [Candidatus Bathyarchaeota archaeon]
MHAIAIGTNDMVAGFRLVGIRGIVASTVDEAKHALLKSMENIDVAIVIISETFSTRLRKTIDELRLNRIAPLIIELPGKPESSSTIDMSKIVGNAIGVKV